MALSYMIVLLFSFASLFSVGAIDTFAGTCGPDGVGCDDGDDDVELVSMELLQNHLKMTKADVAVDAPALHKHLHWQPKGMAKTAVNETEGNDTIMSESALNATGMTLNGEGDLEAFMSALILNSISLFVFLGIFSCLRQNYPLIYKNNVIAGFAPPVGENFDSMFGWIGGSLGATTEQVTESVGLDQAMLLRFTELGMKILAIIGIPMLCIMGPLNCFVGPYAAGEDHLSYLSFGNLENGSWLYWVHAFAVWGVVFAVQTSVYSAQKDFLPHRFNWLRKMDNVRSNTVMVEGICPEQQSDEELKSFFTELLPGARVKSAIVTKDTSTLAALVAQRDDAKAAIKKAEAQWKNNDNKPEDKPTHRESFMGSRVDTIDYFQQQLRSLTTSINEERNRIERAKLAPGGVNLANGFVTFEDRQDAEIALTIQVSQDNTEFVVSSPPAPEDLLWGDLTQDPTAASGRTVFGYLLVAALYFGYLPCVIGITNIANAIDMGPAQAVWQGLAPTMGLQVMVAFLPTFLLIIFRAFFTLKADAWSQHQLQNWYFWFQIFFVVLATAVGQDINSFTRSLIEDPLSLPMVLAATMPFATHFYMNFLVLQWVTHAMNAMRYVSLGKFKAFGKLYEEEEARAMAEPEDQDYYGIGSRSARFTINLVIGIVFGTLSPPINLLCFVNFAICRLVYGYLIPFAETKKADLGGNFWVSQLKHLFVGNIIYCVLMIGVLYQRAATVGPAAIAAPSLLYVIWSMKRFDGAFAWEKLPFREVMAESTKETFKGTKKPEKEVTFLQPEFIDN